MNRDDSVPILRALDALGWDVGDVRVARGFTERLLGLAFRSPAHLGLDTTVMAFPGCRSVHTWWMRFELDIAFIDKSGAVIEVREAVAPFRVLSNGEAWAVLERASRSRPPALIRSRSPGDKNEILA
ncbi:MAG: DUF192 domain-containing protein [Collinsella sp.]|nr:DUF192 domain-containing protein [Collinsella sp.]